VVIADNIIMPGAPGYLEYVRSHPKFSSKLRESHLEYNENTKDGIEISTRISN
jgi:catechol O-methyltransferase